MEKTIQYTSILEDLNMAAEALNSLSDVHNTLVVANGYWQGRIEKIIEVINKFEPINKIVDFTEVRQFSNDLRVVVQMYENCTNGIQSMETSIRYSTNPTYKSITEYIKDDVIIREMVDSVLGYIEAAINTLITKLSDFSKVAIGELINKEQ